MERKEFEKKWAGVDADNLAYKELKEFKNDCFELYESIGFSEKFNSPYDELGEHNGMKFSILRRANEKEVDIEAMPVWLIKFENGDEAYCYPEEVVENT